MLPLPTQPLPFPCDRRDCHAVSWLHFSDTGNDRRSKLYKKGVTPSELDGLTLHLTLHLLTCHRRICDSLHGTAFRDCAEHPTLPTQMCQGLTWGTLPHILRPLGAAFKLRAFIWSFELLWILRVLVALDDLPLDLHCNCGLIWGSGLAVIGRCHQICFAPCVWVLRGRAACGKLSTLPALLSPLASGSLQWYTPALAAPSFALMF